MLDRETSAIVGKVVGSVFSLLFAAVVIGMMFFHYHDKAEIRKLYTVPVAGHVQKCDTFAKRVRSSNGVYSNRLYNVVTVGYEIDGKKLSFTFEDSRSFNVGAPVSLMYNPETLAAVRLSQTQLDRTPYMIGGGIALFSALCGAVCFISFVRGRNDDNLW